MDGGRGLLLDFGGVLTTPVRAGMEGFDRRSGLAVGTCFGAVVRDPEGARLFAELERGGITQEEWNVRTAPLLGVAPDDLLRRVLADLRPEPVMLAAAQAARRAGVRVGILSNSLGLSPWNPYAEYELEKHFDAVVISEEHRLRKPDARLYEIALDALGVPAERVVFVDDTRRNLPPAEALGCTTVLAGPEPLVTRAATERALGVRLTAAAAADAAEDGGGGGGRA